MAHDVLSLSEKRKFLQHCIYVHMLLNGGVEAAI
jgi:hypothetical protein